MGRHREVRTVGRLGSIIRVHLRSSLLVKNMGLDLVAASPRKENRCNPWFQLRF